MIDLNISPCRACHKLEAPICYNTCERLGAFQKAINSERFAQDSDLPAPPEFSGSHKREVVLGILKEYKLYFKAANYYKSINICQEMSNIIVEAYFLCQKADVFLSRWQVRRKYPLWAAHAGPRMVNYRHQREIITSVQLGKSEWLYTPDELFLMRAFLEETKAALRKQQLIAAANFSKNKRKGKYA